MSKSFHFPLDKVLDLKEAVEECRAVELEKSKRAYQEEQSRLNALKSEKSDSLVRAPHNTHSKKPVSVKSLQLSMDYIAQLNNRIKQQSSQVECTLNSVFDHRKKLIVASKERKVMEKIKEHHLAAFLKKYRRKVRKEEDEVAIRRDTNSRSHQ